MIINNLASLIEERKLKQTEISENTGISRSTINNIIKNDNSMFQIETLNKLCQYLEIDISDFFLYIPMDVDWEIEVKDLKFNAGYPVEMSEFTYVEISSITITITINIKKNGKTLHSALITGNMATKYFRVNQMYPILNINFSFSNDRAAAAASLMSMPILFKQYVTSKLATDVNVKIKEFLSVQKNPVLNGDGIETVLINPKMLNKITLKSNLETLFN